MSEAKIDEFIPPVHRTHLHVLMPNQFCTVATLALSLPPDEVIVSLTVYSGDSIEHSVPCWADCSLTVYSGDSSEHSVPCWADCSRSSHCRLLPEAADHHVPGAKQKNGSMFRRTFSGRDTLLRGPE
jgi:hypothetical protein